MMAKAKRYYVVTSKPGMTPFSTVTSLKQARKDVQRARRLGLDGNIIRYPDGKWVRAPSAEMESSPNPRQIKRLIPAKWTSVKIRRTPQGKIQVSIPMPASMRRKNVAAGYVVYQSGTAAKTLSEAARIARRESVEYGTARVERCADNKTMRQYRAGSLVKR